MHHRPKPTTARVLIVFSVAAVLSSCASTGATSQGGREGAIVATDLETGGYNNLYDAVQSLRPLWLPNLGGVYTDRTRVGGADWLRATSIVGVRRIEGLSCEDAMLRMVPSCFTERYIVVSYR